MELLEPGPAEKDPELRALYRRSLERTYEVVRVEQNPWFNFVYGSLTGNDCEVDAAVAHLRDWPLDLRAWSYQNSHRADLRTPPGYRTFKGGFVPFRLAKLSRCAGIIGRCKWTAGPAAGGRRTRRLAGRVLDRALLRIYPSPIRDRPGAALGPTQRRAPPGRQAV